MPDMNRKKRKAMKKRKVVITGMGAVTPLGNGIEAFWAGIRSGKCGIRPITRHESSAQKVKLAAEVDLDPKDHLRGSEVRNMDRFALYALVAGREALKDSGLAEKVTDPDRCGTLVSSGIGGLASIVREQAKGQKRGFDRVSPFFIPMSISNMAAGRLAIEAGFRGYCSCVVTACAGGANAVGDAMRMIRHGYADVMLCGGAESAITPLALGGFTSMRALHEGSDPNRACIPFDAERSGFVLGEGAGILVLEEYEHALRRGAKIYGELSGYGTTCDAYHITAPEPSGTGAAQAMKLALADAGLTGKDIDYINAHGTSTELNDKTETKAIKEVFGQEASRLPVSSTKSMTGHMLGAAGSVEAIVCLLALQDGFIPATINYKVFDPECDLDVVPNVGRQAKLSRVMSNSLGFGGHNASLIFSKLGE
jgi:3-oxoacyl-[acyl-carrier-protein] synthase II